MRECVSHIPSLAWTRVHSSFLYSARGPDNPFLSSTPARVCIHKVRRRQAVLQAYSSSLTTLPGLSARLLTRRNFSSCFPDSLSHPLTSQADTLSYKHARQKVRTDGTDATTDIEAEVATDCGKGQTACKCRKRFTGGDLHWHDVRRMACMNLSASKYAALQYECT